eukprot:CAMPEP_0171742306 /NCGR_PEP_ID=MMETSP0991-20121206/36130_1 /TAXON_ID=483369 /ORGANISM="non described non described, Strain CCMP2098" /LENGTH=49 /DNA_ID= /DNA_START= /DNA_END= /DNA_ORIENTATION=
MNRRPCEVAATALSTLPPPLGRVLSGGDAPIREAKACAAVGSAQRARKS